LVPQSIR
jgi:hypothetical protein